MNQGCFGNVGEKHDKASWKPYIANQKINTLHCQRKNWSTRRTNDTCIVCTAVGKKACLGMKQCRAVKKSSLKAVALYIVELHLAEGIMQLVSIKVQLYRRNFQNFVTYWKGLKLI